jgi:hypothetical protein
MPTHPLLLTRPSLPPHLPRLVLSLLGHRAPLAFGRLRYRVPLPRLLHLYKLRNKGHCVWANYRRTLPSSSAALPPSLRRASVPRPPTRPGIAAMSTRRPLVHTHDVPAVTPPSRVHLWRARLHVACHVVLQSVHTTSIHICSCQENVVGAKLPKFTDFIDPSRPSSGSCSSPRPNCHIEQGNRTDLLLRVFFPV